MVSGGAFLVPYKVDMPQILTSLYGFASHSEEHGQALAEDPELIAMVLAGTHVLTQFHRTIGGVRCRLLDPEDFAIQGDMCIPTEGDPWVPHQGVRPIPVGEDEWYRPLAYSVTQVSAAFIARATSIDPDVYLGGVESLEVVDVNGPYRLTAYDGLERVEQYSDVVWWTP